MMADASAKGAVYVVLPGAPLALNKDKANREEVDSLMQRNVVPFRGAAE